MAATQLNTLADDIIAKSLSGSTLPGGKGEFFELFGRQIRYPVMDGAVSSLFYTQRLYQFPLGVLGISLATAIFPVMSEVAASKNYIKLAKTTKDGLQATFFLSLPSMVGLILVARPLVAAIYQRGKFTAADTDLASQVLIFYALGLCGFFAQQVLPRAFYAMKDSKVPARTAALAVIANVILNLTLIWPMGVTGLALSTSLCSYMQAGILLWLLHRKFQLHLAEGFWPTFRKTAFGTLLMAAAGWAALATMGELAEDTWGNVVRLVVLVAVCGGVYAGAAWVLKNPMLALIVSARRKKGTAPGILPEEGQP